MPHIKEHWFSNNKKVNTETGKQNHSQNVENWQKPCPPASPYWPNSITVAFFAIHEDRSRSSLDISGEHCPFFLKIHLFVIQTTLGPKMQEEINSWLLKSVSWCHRQTTTMQLNTFCDWSWCPFGPLGVLRFLLPEQDSLLTEKIGIYACSTYQRTLCDVKT